MALKLRRGLDANRTDIVPAEGELIYTTDTKSIYVGDGATPGGNVVTSSGGGGGDITGITDNTTGPVLTLNDASVVLDVPLTAGGNIDITNYTLLGDGDIALTGDISVSGVGTGIITANSVVSDSIVGDVKGSVFGDDSSPIVDAINNSLLASNLTIENIIPSTNILNLNGTAQTKFNINSENANTSSFSLVRNANTDISGDATAQGEILFERNDPINGQRTSASIRAFDNIISFALYPFTSDYFMTFEGGKLALGDLTPTEKLHVDGNAIITGTLTADTIVSNAAGTPEISSAAGIVITAVNDFEVDAANLQIDDVDLKAKLDISTEGVVMLGKEASNDATAFVPAVVNAPILSSITDSDTLDGTDRVKEIFRYRFDRYTSGGEILIALNDYDTGTPADRYLVKKFLFHDSSGDGSAFTITEIGSSGNTGLFTSLTVGVDNPGGGVDFFLTFTLAAPDAAVSATGYIITGQTTFTSNPLAITISGY